MKTNSTQYAPASIKQIQNTLYRERQKSKPIVHASNIADEILEVIGMLNTHPFVQQIVHRKGEVPSVMCYTNEQIVDMNHFLKSLKSPILGINRTFNMGTYYVTAIVYKTERVIRKKKKDYPIIVGPILLHKDATTATYKQFLSHIADQLGVVNEVELNMPSSSSFEFGSYDEKALTNAIEQVFPNASRRLCSKHIKDNLQFHLQNKVGLNISERTEIIEKFFGNEGLACANDTFDFEKRKHALSTLYEKYPDSKKYLETVTNRINKFVYTPKRKNDEVKLWTNNNAESANHIFKWKPKKAPELIEKLYMCINYQFINLKSSLYFSGEYELCGRYKAYSVSEQK
ncbi:hypothetical protein SNE40_002917 [Patella caerulea]|uniref:MULE transposase domain-containing protein n=1 Tax=Patella caerulea TaxID=87958 RepID=A0AAN8Q0C0_PATCE